MCGQRTAVDMLKTLPDRGGLSDAAMLLHEKQCEDFETMQKEINEIKQDVCCVKETQVELKKVQEETNKKLDNMIALFEKKSSFMGNLKEILNNKVFIYILITLFAAGFGVKVSDLGTFILK